MDEVERIARGLTKAQRKAVLDLSGDWQWWGRAGISTAHYLRGTLTEARFGSHPVSLRTARQYRLTPLGLQVRKHLETSHG